MYSVVGEINKIRGSKKPSEILLNTNPYRVLLRDGDFNSAYYFSCPIYKTLDGQLVDLDFKEYLDGYYYEGSDVRVAFKRQEILLENICSSISLNIDCTTFQKHIFNDRNCLVGDDKMIYPTFNGIAIEVKSGYTLDFSLKASMVIVDKGNYISISDSFKTVAVINLSYSKTIKGEIVPSNIKLTRHNDLSFSITAVSDYSLIDSNMFEVNLYTYKVILDSPIDNMERDRNFAYSDVAFVTKNDIKEQQLFFRVNTNYLEDIKFKRVDKAYIYFPQLANHEAELIANGVSQYWCCFALTWNMKPPISMLICESKCENGYIKLDITKYICALLWEEELNGYGVELEIKNSTIGSQALASGDNYFMPPILEIKYKN